MPMPRKDDPEKFCQYCGTKMQRQMIGARLEDWSAFARRVYCNRTCMANAMEGKIKVMNERATHRQSRKTVSQRCEVCGATGRKLHVHHKDGNGLNNSDDNLITLCVPCHQRWHSPNYTDCGTKRKPCLHCEQPSYRKGLCLKHLQRFKKYGSPFLTKRKHGSQYVLVDERES
jgi:hypothetical protein